MLYAFLAFWAAAFFVVVLFSFCAHVCQHLFWDLRRESTCKPGN